MKTKRNFVFLCSGQGTTFEYLSQLSWVNSLLLVTDRSPCEALKKAQKLNIPSEVVSPREYSSYSDWDQALLKKIQFHLSNQKVNSVDGIILAGFLYRLGPQFLSHFTYRVVNSHPSLLPLFGGKSMYGLHVHKAVLESGYKKTGITIHYVNEEYDKGRVIAQKEIPVLSEDTPESLEKRVKKHEKQFYADTLQSLDWNLV